MAKLFPNPWVIRQLHHIVAGGTVLDLACGTGRHSRYLLQAGFRVTAVDKDTSALVSSLDIQDTSQNALSVDFLDVQHLEVVRVDLEKAPGWQNDQKFDGILVTNYLHRPLFPKLIEWLAEDGILIYQTFMRGDETLGGVKNPGYLLWENELQEVFSTELETINFWQGYVERPRPAMIQRICCQASKQGSIRI